MLISNFLIETAKHAWIVWRDSAIESRGTNSVNNLRDFSLEITRNLLYFLLQFQLLFPAILRRPLNLYMLCDSQMGNGIISEL